MSDEDGNRLFRREQILKWPNLVTLIRLFCIPVFVYLLFVSQARLLATILLAVVGWTDWVDGWIARRHNQMSEFGAVFDPVVDRLLFIVVVPCLVVDMSLPLVVAVLAFARELFVAFLALVYTARSGRRFVVTFEGKTGAFLLMFALPLFLGSTAGLGIGSWLRWLAWYFTVPGLLYSWYSALAQYGVHTYQASITKEQT